jgi:type IV pilus assembly protein PilM
MIKKILPRFQGIIDRGRLGKKGILAFDLGSYSIKIAEVQIVKGEPILTNFVRGRTYKNVIINGIINDFQYLLSNIQNILDVFKSNTKIVNLSLSYDLVIFDSFKSPHIPNEEEIKTKINDEIPYKIEDVYYSYYIIPKKDFYQVFYLIAKKEIIEQYENLIKTLEYQANNIDADFVNLHNLIETIYGEKTKVIVDWGDSKIKLLFCEKEVPIYSRELFNLGIKNLRKDIIKILKVDFDTAEALIVNPERDNQPEVKKIYKNYIKEVLEELETTIKFVTGKFNLTIENIFLVGGGANIPNISEIFSESLKINTQIIDLKKLVKFSDNFDPDYTKIINTQGAIAVATAMRDFI